MEKWEREHLNANRPKLVKETICNEIIFAHLLSQRVLSPVDVAHIKSKTDRYEQAAALYDFVETRENGFVEMARALAQVNQTGPCSVFLDGFARRVMPNINIDFLGRTLPITDLFDPSEINEIVEKIKNHLILEQYVSLYSKSASTEPIKLVKDTIPAEISYYVSRSLSKRVNVNPKLFKQNCLDVFVFKGIGWSQLMQMAAPNRVTNSSTQLLSHSLSTRFIFLEDDEDWEDISSAVSVPVHLIKYEQENERYIIEKTTGGSAVIHQFLQHHHKPSCQNESVSIPEENFFEEVSGDGSCGVCICDLPGMGKSLLLANLARRMKGKHPDRLVVFIQLSHFLRFVVASKRKQAAFTVDAIFAKKTVFEYVTHSKLEYFLLTELVNKNTIKLELFLDGFDEIQVDQVETAKQLLTLLAKLQNTKIYVTSRPSMRAELEECLQVIPYDILPFSRANQVYFLVAFWSALEPKSSKEKLGEFAKFCIEELKKRLKKNEVEITGIPLQCRLVGDVFSPAAKIFAGRRRNIPPSQLCKSVDSLSDLYKRYFDLRFCKIVPRHVRVDTCEKTLSCAAEQGILLMEAVTGGIKENQEMKRFHMLQALIQLFPKSHELFREAFGATIPNFQTSNILSVGLLQRQHYEGLESFEFLHRTFAEYLVAEFFAGLLDSDREENNFRVKLLPLLFKDLIARTMFSPPGSWTRFQFSVIIYFLNSACAEKSINSQDELLFKTFASCVSGKNFNKILTSITHANHLNLLLHLKQLLSKMDATYLQMCKSSTISHVFTLVERATKHCSVLFVEQLFQLFREHFQVDVDKQDKDTLNGELGPHYPLGAAIKRHDYEMVQFIAARMSTKYALAIFRDNFAHLAAVNRERIYNCIINGSKNKAADGTSALVRSREKNIEYIKFLLEQGVDPRSADECETVVHRAAVCMNGKEFGELCRLLVDVYGAVDMFQEKEGSWRCPLPEILANKKIANDMILKIYNLPWLDANDTNEGRSFEANMMSPQQRANVDINYADHKGRTLLMCAQVGTRGVETLRRMIENGANAGAQDQDGNTFAHYMTGKHWAQHHSPKDYHALVLLLIRNQMGRVFKLANKKGETPLHVSVRSMELLPETLDLLVGRTSVESLCSDGGNPEQQDDNPESCYLDINAKDNRVRSILWEAVSCKRSLSFVKHLVDLGADWKIKVGHRNLATFSACGGLVDHLNYFMERGCNINEVDADGNNALQAVVRITATTIQEFPWKYYGVELPFLAAIGFEKNAGFRKPVCLLNVIEFLVANGAEKENKNNDDETAYMIAVKKWVKDERILKLVK